EVVYEFYLRGFTFRPISLAESGASEFLEDGGQALIPPFTALPGLGDTAALSIARERDKSPFLSVEDIQIRTKANKAHIDALRDVGAFGALPESTQMDLF
ncbi:MAG: hypothetical protein FWG93_08470, partial [Oscillospiraceae bacterium]|nr:hypothetical protein [Oscillospiraceae bacterium]